MVDDQVIKRGRRAESVLKDEMLAEAFEAIKKDQLAVIASSAPGDQERRESAYFMMKAIEALSVKLNSFFSAGKLEERKIKN